MNLSAEHPAETPADTFEIEQKFVVDDGVALITRLAELGASSSGTVHHADTYYRHPSRDFVETQEALRIRRTDGIAAITYKGPKLKQDDPNVKARRELEWLLGEHDVDGSNTDQLLLALGFQHVATVEKRRQSFEWSDSDEQGMGGFSVTLDQVTEVGTFAEIELVVSGEDAIAAASERIAKLADRLALTRGQPQSYLELFLEQRD